MLSGNQDLLEAIAGIVTEAVRPIYHRLDVLTERVDAVESRLGRIEAQLRNHDERLEIVEERVEKGFRSIKEDIGLFFRDNQNLRRQISRQNEGVDAEILQLKQRLATLEAHRLSP
jgi:hypothetical protein